MIMMHWLEQQLFPPACLLCGQTAEEEALCLACAQSVTGIGFACPLCAIPNDDASVCQGCSQHPPIWQSAQSAFVYQGSIRHLMQQWKYHPSRAAGRVICDRFRGWLWRQDNLPEVDAVIAIPMHRNKLAKRGFNTAYDLAQLVSQRLNRPLLTNMLVRRFSTPAQAGLNKHERQQNLAGVFAIQSNTLSATYTQILLVDDVLTTGSTLAACTQLLQQAGVHQVHILTLARALSIDDDHEHL